MEDGRWKMEMKPMIPLKKKMKDGVEGTPDRRSGQLPKQLSGQLSEQIEEWRRHLQELDRSPGTVKKYVDALRRFLAWYELEDQQPLQITALTPIALIGYRNHLQHEQQKSVSTINLRISALRAWCGWLVDAGYLANDPATRIKLVSGDRNGSAGAAGAGGTKREGLTGSQVNALLRQAQSSRDPQRNYAILQIFVQTGIR
ncbi:MAG: phage integrase N-terminal SAM-like domain-containing protein, partial [Chloroflexota bacterium]|nr:phage integrase N-terminal SAM-like domain-containing protein [Chloroflexota bacterium]